jgi:CTP:molybdopterin cytidylyltransferase MocA
VNASVAALILAAGASRRLGQPKQLLMHGNETLLGRAHRLATEADVAPVVVVLGAYADKIRREVNLENGVTIVNDRWQDGMASSIHAGLDALDLASPAVRGVLMLTCDQARLTAAHLRTLIATFDEHFANVIVASAYADTVGIPALFPRGTFAALRALRGDRGARSLLSDPPGARIAVPFRGGEVDIDRPEDLVRLE